MIPKIAKIKMFQIRFIYDCGEFKFENILNVMLKIF